MGTLASEIRDAVRDERYLFGIHANNRLRERRIMGWQLVAEMDSAALIRERPAGVPYPVAEFELTLADGTPVKAVWAWIPAEKVAKLVTVHFLKR